MIGNVVNGQQGGCFCMPDPTEFMDSNHLGKRISIEIKAEGDEKSYQGLYRGLHEAVKTMKFGDDASFFIPSEMAYGAEGLSRSNGGGADHVNRNPVDGGVSFIKIGPREDLTVDLVWFRVLRDGKWHNRAIKNKP
eukprot:scaffold35913_cov275-Amphora_coffeaeformis.AAC.1